MLVTLRGLRVSTTGPGAPTAVELCLPLPTDVKKSHECNGFKNQITYLFELKAKACCGFLFGQLPCA